MEATPGIQDYLKAIYSLSATGDDAATTDIAKRVGVSAASATAMIKKLSALGHLTHTRYRGVALTTSGRKLALEVVRHHRLLEAYLHEALEVPWDRVHAEAEVLEHALSEELEDRLAEYLGHPTHDPHGDPIPSKDGTFEETLHPPLSEFDPGTAVVRRVSDRDPEALRYLGRLGLMPGTAIEVVEQGPFGGPVWVRVGRKRHAISRELAGGIYVSAGEGA